MHARRCEDHSAFGARHSKAHRLSQFVNGGGGASADEDDGVGLSGIDGGARHVPGLVSKVARLQGRDGCGCVRIAIKR